jgi:5-methylcytosine-specific restriction protein B
MAQTGRERVGQIQRAVCQALLDHAYGLPVQTLTDEVEKICVPTAFENADYPKRPGVRRFPKIVRFDTISLVKAGWLVKDDGTWTLTPDGRQAYMDFPDPIEFYLRASKAYRTWQDSQPMKVKYAASEAREDAEAAMLEAGGQARRRAWLVRGRNVSGTDVLPIWFDEGIVSITSALPDLPVTSSETEVAAALALAYAEKSAIALGLYRGIWLKFMREMHEGDLVVTVDGKYVYVGMSGPRYIDRPLLDRQRDVHWRNVAAPFNRDQLSSDAADGLRGQLTISELTSFLGEFARLGGIDLEVADAIGETVDAASTLTAPTQEFADKLMMPLDWLKETVELLNEKRQIILYGPPGTGKTYLAQQLSQSLAEDAGGEYTIVQFHPSYAYEDFFQGIRPRLSDPTAGTLTFELVPGPLRRIADEAAANPSTPYVLIIDEINRANLAKVFGELYFLLEYRGQKVSLQYSSGEEFLLPKNLYFIGTMNTADRSIALVDAAMRRRFYFRSLFPGAAPIKDLLRTWLDQEGFSQVPADVLDHLNDRIGDADFSVGPSYLMTSSVGKPGGLERIWRSSILPLLEDHYYGEGRDVEAEFGLAELLGHRVASGPSTADGDNEQT